MKQKIAETFDKIQAEEELKRHTKEFLAHKTNQFCRRPLFVLPKPAIVFACLLLLVFGTYPVFFTSVSTISIDVNPSVELDVNRFDRVISVRSYNEDGNRLLASADVRFLDYRDALHRLLETEDMQSYLSPDSLLSVTVFGSDEAKNKEMLNNVAGCTSEYGNVHCSSGNPEDVSDAHARGMSCGKYQAYLELYRLDPSVTPEEMQTLSMRQILDRIRELSADSPLPDESAGSGHHSRDTQTGETATEASGTENGQQNGGGHHLEIEHGHHGGR